ncbi:gluconokinase [Spirochaetota bacterium]
MTAHKFQLEFAKNKFEFIRALINTEFALFQPVIFIKSGVIMPKAIIIMGVSGCGKSSVGHAVAKMMGLPFYDGDDFHPQENVEKMAAGSPLNDANRQPWLENLHQLILTHFQDGRSLVIACSSLKNSYRQILRGEIDNVRFVYLRGDFNLIYTRMRQRKGHYMKPEMLRSQFAALEEPKNALVLDVTKSIDILAEEIVFNENSDK